MISPSSTVGSSKTTSGCFGGAGATLRSSSLSARAAIRIYERDRESKSGRSIDFSLSVPSACAPELLTGSAGTSTSIAHAAVDGDATVTTGEATGGGAGATTGGGAGGGSVCRGGGCGTENPGGANAAAEGLKLNEEALGLKLKDGFGNADGGGGGGGGA